MKWALVKHEAFVFVQSGWALIFSVEESFFYFFFYWRQNERNELECGRELLESTLKNSTATVHPERSDVEMKEKV